MGAVWAIRRHFASTAPRVHLGLCGRLLPPFSMATRDGFAVLVRHGGIEFFVRTLADAVELAAALRSKSKLHDEGSTVDYGSPRSSCSLSLASSCHELLPDGLSMWAAESALLADAQQGVPQVQAAEQIVGTEVIESKVDDDAIVQIKSYVDDDPFVHDDDPNVDDDPKVDDDSLLQAKSKDDDSLVQIKSNGDEDLFVQIKSIADDDSPVQIKPNGDDDSIVQVKSNVEDDSFVQIEARLANLMANLMPNSRSRAKLADLQAQLADMKMPAKLQGTFVVGQEVERRDRDDDEWGPGYVTSLDPLLVTFSELRGPAEKGHPWRQVRQIPPAYATSQFVEYRAGQEEQVHQRESFRKKNKRRGR